MKISGWANDRIKGLTTGTDNPSRTAPRRPPMADAENAAPNARAASPLAAIG